jgi:hypothetical protein
MDVLPQGQPESHDVEGHLGQWPSIRAFEGRARIVSEEMMIVPQGVV